VGRIWILGKLGVNDQPLIAYKALSTALPNRYLFWRVAHSPDTGRAAGLKICHSGHQFPDHRLGAVSVH
jgi:hypothetical protein